MCVSVLAHKTLNPWWHEVCKVRFQGAASPCSRWPIASFTLPGFSKFQRTPFRLYPDASSILGLTSPKVDMAPYMMLVVGLYSITQHCINDTVYITLVVGLYT